MIEQIQQKIDLLVSNAIEKLEVAETSAQKNDFKTATALLVTAFEERTKAAVLQFVDLGFPIVNQVTDLDYVFRQHDARHYIGFFVDCMYEVFDDIKPILKEIARDKNYLLSLLKLDQDLEMQMKLIQWIASKTDSFLEKLDFYQNIEKTRQSGLYIDVLDHGTLGASMNEEDYLFIKSRLNTIHLLSSDLKDIKIDHMNGGLPELEDSKNEMLNHDMPSHIVSAIKLVRKERNKVFDDLRIKLKEFKELQ